MIQAKLSRKISKLLLSVAVLGLAATAQASTKATSSGCQSSTDSLAYFIVQNGRHAVLKPGSLVLQNAQNKTLWFANSPSTDTGYMTLAKYMNLWATPTAALMAEQPNATLIGYFYDAAAHEEKQLTLVVTLRNAKLTNDGKDVSYTVTKSLLVPDKKSYNQQVTLSHPTLLIDTVSGTGIDWG